MCGHPHAAPLPVGSKYHFRLDIGRTFGGCACWGWGNGAAGTARRLGLADRREFLELNRFFCTDSAPANSESRFLAFTHRLLAKWLPQLKLLYTYAAGFQGMYGAIYQAAGYTYLGKSLANSFLWIPGRGLVHQVSLWNRYSIGQACPKRFAALFPGCRRWLGWNYEYGYPVHGHRLTAAGPSPTVGDPEIWTIDVNGVREEVPLTTAKRTPIVRLPVRRAKSETGDTPTPNQVGEGGSTPTLALASI
jgi:hypothetical protein